MDSKIPKADTARQNSRPPEAIAIRSMPDEWVVDQRDGDTGGPCAYRDPNQTYGQYGRGCPDTEGGNESGDPEGIPGATRILMGRQLLGGRIFCRDSRERG